MKQQQHRDKVSFCGIDSICFSTPSPSLRLLLWQFLLLLCTTRNSVESLQFFVPSSYSRHRNNKKHIHNKVKNNGIHCNTRRYQQEQQQHAQPRFVERGSVALADLSSSSSAFDNSDNKEKLEYIKKELTGYLEKRKQENADETAKGMVGKTVGGTKGNVVLEYVSGAPNKEEVIEEPPQIFDYDELSKYGYGYLVTPIMDAGGRNFIYEFMGMETPQLPERLKPKSAPKLVIDRTGETDKARYSGLKMGQVLDDDVMAKALEEAQRKKKAGQQLRPKLEEEEYVPPFADKRNTSPTQTPLWTPEKLDEYGKSQGRAQAWARRSKMGEFVKDPYETLELPFTIQLYSIVSFGLVSFAFGRSTPTFLSDLSNVENPSNMINVLQIPALTVLLASVGSAVVSGVVFAPNKKRSTLIWTLKGFMGGPITIAQLRQLDKLVTRQEKKDAAVSKE